MNDDTDPKTPPTPSEDTSSGKALPPQAARALAEAEERRAKAAKDEAPKGRKEFQGPKGPEPTRFGDWERKGIASDF
jgi:hypothetical protein